MRRWLADHSGLATIENLVAVVVISITALGFAAGLAGTAAIGQRVRDHDKAMALASQQLDRLLTLDYERAGLNPPPPKTCDGGSGGAGQGACEDAGRNASDWKEIWKAICAPESAGGSPDPSDPNCAEDRLVTLTNPEPIAYDQDNNDPRRARIVATTKKSPPTPDPVTVYTHGPIIYTYIYWDRWDGERYRKQWKLATVVVRYADRSEGQPVTSGTVRLTAAIVDTPGVRGVEG